MVLTFLFQAETSIRPRPIPRTPTTLPTLGRPTSRTTTKTGDSGLLSREKFMTFKIFDLRLHVVVKRFASSMDLKLLTNFRLVLKKAMVGISNLAST